MRFKVCCLGFMVEDFDLGIGAAITSLVLHDLVEDRAVLRLERCEENLFQQRYICSMRLRCVGRKKKGSLVVPGFGFRVSGFGFRVSDFRFRVSGFGSRDWGLWFRV